MKTWKQPWFILTDPASPWVHHGAGALGQWPAEAGRVPFLVDKEPRDIILLANLSIREAEDP